MNEDLEAAFDATLVLLRVPRAAHATARARFASVVESVFSASAAPHFVKWGIEPSVEQVAENVALGAKRDMAEGRLERVIRC